MPTQPYITISGIRRMPLTLTLAASRLVVLTSTLAMIAVIQPVMSSAAVNDTDQFSGTFSLPTFDGVTTLNLEQSGMTLMGTLKGPKITMEIDAKVEGQKASGLLSSEDESFYFESALDKDGRQLHMVVMEMEVSSRNAIRSTAASLTFQRDAAEDSSAAAAPGPRTAPWTMHSLKRTFGHPLGFSFLYPPHWNVREKEYGLALVPPTVELNAGGRAMVYTWEGANPDGMAIRAQTYLAPVENYVISLNAVGGRASIAANEKTHAAMVATFGRGESKKQ